jgi:transposase
MVERVAGLDVHKRTVTACVRVPDGQGGRREVKRTFQTFQDSLGDLASWLEAERVTEVAMEATGVFWKPVWHVLEEHDFELLLVNARHVKMVPGRKTDVGDAAWLAQLLECGLLRGSFVPPPAIRELRDLTRYRKRLVQDRTREGQRVEKVLEGAGIKLASVASKTLGVSGREMLDAIVAGERDPERLAEYARGRLAHKHADLVRALDAGRISDHHVLMLGLHLERIDQLAATIGRLDDRIDEVIAPFAQARDRLTTIPGIAKTNAEVLIAEIGVDMSIFPTAGHLASWAGVCPGNNESAGKHRSGRTTPGSPWLLDALTQAAWAASHTKDTFLSAKFRRLTPRTGKRRAAVATAHAIVISIWHMLSTGNDYVDLGADHFDRKADPARQAARLSERIRALGYDVTLTPSEDAA